MINQNDNVVPLVPKNIPSPQPKGRLVSITDVDWQKGFDAAVAGASQVPVPAGIDNYSWFSGWIEGDATSQECAEERNK